MDNRFKGIVVVFLVIVSVVILNLQDNPGFTETASIAGEEKMEKVVKTDQQWREILTPEQYRILRKKGTEMACSGPHLENKGQGIYRCVGCGNPVFKSQSKFESGTGWPSFFQPYTDQSIETKEDSSYGMKRIEVLCGRCGGHLGHVFNDGPAPTGLRYCINGTVLEFEKTQ